MIHYSDVWFCCVQGPAPPGLSRDPMTPHQLYRSRYGSYTHASSHCHNSAESSSRTTQVPVSHSLSLSLCLTETTHKHNIHSHNLYCQRVSSARLRHFKWPVFREITSCPKVSRKKTLVIGGLTRTFYKCQSLPVLCSAVKRQTHFLTSV